MGSKRTKAEWQFGWADFWIGGQGIRFLSKS
jgi:hypothetical protein